MLDVVANHMGNQPGSTGDFRYARMHGDRVSGWAPHRYPPRASMFNPFSSASHYHSYCIINNWNNQVRRNGSVRRTA